MNPWLILMHSRILFIVFLVMAQIVGARLFLSVNKSSLAQAQVPPGYLFMLTTIRPDITSGGSTHATSESPSSFSQGTTQSMSKRNSIEPTEGFSPLHQSVKEGDFGKTKSLISGGTNINQKTSSGKTPLHLAVLQRNGSMVELLLRSGADVTVKDASGRAPMDYWDSETGLEILRLLQSYEKQQALPSATQMGKPISR